MYILLYNVGCYPGGGGGGRGAEKDADNKDNHWTHALKTIKHTIVTYNQRRHNTVLYNTLDAQCQW